MKPKGLSHDRDHGIFKPETWGELCGSLGEEFRHLISIIGNKDTSDFQASRQYPANQLSALSKARFINSQYEYYQTGVQKIENRPHPFPSEQHQARALELCVKNKRDYTKEAQKLIDEWEDNPRFQRLLKAEFGEPLSTAMKHLDDEDSKCAGKTHLSSEPTQDAAVEPQSAINQNSYPATLNYLLKIEPDVFHFTVSLFRIELNIAPILQPYTSSNWNEKESYAVGIRKMVERKIQDNQSQLGLDPVGFFNDIERRTKLILASSKISDKDLKNVVHKITLEIKSILLSKQKIKEMIEQTSKEQRTPDFPGTIQSKAQLILEQSGILKKETSELIAQRIRQNVENFLSNNNIRHSEELLISRNTKTPNLEKSTKFNVENKFQPKSTSVRSDATHKPGYVRDYAKYLDSLNLASQTSSFTQSTRLNQELTDISKQRIVTRFRDNGKGKKKINLTRRTTTFNKGKQNSI